MCVNKYIWLIISLCMAAGMCEWDFGSDSCLVVLLLLLAMCYYCVHALSGRNLLSVHNPRTCLASHYDSSSCLAPLLTATPCWSSSLLVFLSFLFLSHLVFSLACQQFWVVFTPLSYSLTTSDSLLLSFCNIFFYPFLSLFAFSAHFLKFCLPVSMICSTYSPLPVTSQPTCGK